MCYSGDEFRGGVPFVQDPPAGPQLWCAHVGRVARNCHLSEKCVLSTRSLDLPSAMAERSIDGRPAVNPFTREIFEETHGMPMITTRTVSFHLARERW